VDDHGTLMKPRTNLLGWVMGGVPAAFMLVDAVMKLLALPVVVKSAEELGLGGVGMARGLGALLLASTLLYLAPQTSAIGAILLTGYLGGSVITHLRVGNPLFTHALFGVYLGILLWGGLYLRNERLRALIALH
jgi:hypothetical protein